MMRQLCLSMILAVSAWSNVMAQAADRNYTTLDGSVSLPLPKGVKRSEVREQQDAQKITSRCMFLPKDGPISGIYTTKVRDEFPKSSKILDRTAARYRQNIRAEDGSTLEHIEKVLIDGRLFLMSIVRHIERGNATRLKDKWLKKDLLVRADVLEARLYLVYKGHFVEFKRMLLPKHALNMGSKDENAVASAALRGVIKFACTSNALTNKEKKSLLSYKIRSDYVVGVFKDPSLELSKEAP